MYPLIPVSPPGIRGYGDKGKYVDYLKFRKVYIMITEGKHLDSQGILKIKSITTKGFSETRTQEV